MAAALSADNEICVVHIVALAEQITMPIHASRQAKVALQTSKKTGISAEYFNFSDVFSSNSVVELPEYTKINNHFINLLDNKQPLYSSIYSLELVELEMLKIYIETNLASSFIWPSKSLIGALILFV